MVSHSVALRVTVSVDDCGSSEVSDPPDDDASPPLELEDPL